MTLSVLISVYEGDLSEYFECALKSIWDNQTRKPDEIVLVVDGYIGRELEVLIKDFELRCYSLKLLRNDENLGLSRTLQIGLDACSCEYVARMDADDISEPIRFERMLGFLNENEQVDVLGSSIKIFGSSLTKIRSYPTSHLGVLKYIRKASPHAHPAVIFKKESIQACGGYSKELRTTQDLELWFRSLKEGNIHANLPEVLLNFRVSSEFWKRRSIEKAKVELKIYREGFKLLGVPRRYEVFIYVRFMVRRCKRLSKFIYKLIR